MSEWNERIKKAKKAALTCFPGAPFVKDMLIAFADALREPEGQQARSFAPGLTPCCGCDEMTGFNRPHCKSGCGPLCFNCEYRDSEGFTRCPKCYREIGDRAKTKKWENRAAAEEYSADFGRQAAEKAFNPQPLVRHPDRLAVWLKAPSGEIVLKRQGDETDYVGQKYEWLTPAEAFCEGAEVEGRFPDGSILRAKINTKGDDGCWMSFLNHRSYQLSDADWFLVTPAPEGNEITVDPELPHPDMPIREPGKDQYGYQKEDQK